MPNGSAGSSPAVRTTVLTALLILVACGERRRDDQPVVVSAIGEALRPGGRQADASVPARMLTAATAQGLVRFDAAGGVEPGLAERWIVIDGGLSYIFRLKEARWPDGERVTARQIVRSLRQAVAESSGHELTPFLTAIDEIVAMTPEVIEVRLSRPRPDLLKLFAQPELAVRAPDQPVGTGPFRLVAWQDVAPLLRPALDPDRVDDEEAAPPGPERDVVLLGESAAVGIVRFRERRSDLVTGGAADDWPLLAAAGIAPANIRLDPAAGLFGLSITSRAGFLAEAENRAAIALALDRTALTGAFTPDWGAVETLLPEKFDSAAPAAVPAWAQVPAADRIAVARARVAAWTAKEGEPVRLRVALPAGPGGTLLWGAIGSALRRVAIEPTRVGPAAPAELRLLDKVAPYDNARWYLAQACRPCGEEAEAELEAARLAPTLAERAQATARADAALAADVAFVPIARPLRWSLVAQRLRAWTGNPRAWHPLNHLRNNE